MDVDLDIGHRTDVGRRRERNEDCLGIYRPEREDEIDRRGTLLIVADGMGGYAAGEVASRTAVETVVNSYYGDLAGDVDDSLTRAIQVANEAVLEEASRSAERAGMGSTIAVAAIREGELAVANAGDSRVYLIRNGEIQQISRDHSWVAELVAVGKITPEEAKRHPMRNVVTRSLGGRPGVEVEVYPRTPLQPGDIVLLCSDGLWGMVSSEQIQRIVQSHSAQAAADALVAAANDAGGHDNITALVCRVLGDDADVIRSDQEGTVQLEDTQPRPQLNI